MRYSQAKQGRVFVIRLEDGDVLHESIEAFAREHGIQAASLIALGGADSASRLVVGPEQGRTSPIVPKEHLLRDVHEVVGVGTLFPNGEGQPVLHMHVAAGRGDGGHRLPGLWLHSPGPPGVPRRADGGGAIRDPHVLWRMTGDQAASSRRSFSFT